MEAPSVPTAPAPHHECSRSSGQDLSQTAFRLQEKRYKLYKPSKQAGKRVRPPPTDFSEVVDPRDVAANTAENRALLRELAPGVLAFDGVPGLTLFPRAVPEEAQRRWAAACLSEYACSPPHPNNMTTLDPELRTNGYRAGLRWATLGYSYNWTEKSYHPEKRTAFPDGLRDLMAGIVAKLAAADASQRAACSGYEAQTAIVNYYPVGSMMMAHQDISETCLEKPLVSLSLGCSAVFLMGTTSRDDRPHAFMLRSGDVVAFTGPARVAYHAVPRILEDPPAHFAAEDPVLGEATKELRLNINVRQVFANGGGAAPNDAAIATDDTQADVAAPKEAAVEDQA